MYSSKKWNLYFAVIEKNMYTSDYYYSILERYLAVTKVAVH